MDSGGIFMEDGMEFNTAEEFATLGFNSRRLEQRFIIVL
jgi:hypothetical protein